MTLGKKDVGMKMLMGLGLALASLVAVGCISGSSVSRQEVLVSLGTNLMVPRFEGVARDVGALRSSIEGFCADPSSVSLEESKSAWGVAKQSWMRSRAIGFGPLMDRRSRSYVDWSPIEPERIENTLASQDSITADYVREFLSSAQRGFGALEYLMFSEGALDALSDGDGLRCDYLVATVVVASEEMDGVVEDWVGAGGEEGGYYGEFTGQASSALLPLAAVSETVRTTIFLLRSIADMQLGAALGMNDGDADPTAIRSGAALSGVSDIREQILGMRDAYLGAAGAVGDDDEGWLGIGSLVRGVSEDADDRVKAAFEDAVAAVDRLEEPLHDTIYSDRANAVEVYEVLKDLQRTLSTEVVSLLGITVGFADTDGDGG